MPHEILNLQQAADYLHMDLRQLRRLAERDKIPARRSGDDWLFRKSDVDHWVEAQLHELDGARLAEIERGVRRHHGHELDERGLLVTPLIPEGAVAAPLVCKTRSSVLRGLVDLAEQCHLVYARDELLAEIQQREQMCSTAIAPGTALPHPRHPVPWDIAESFVAIGRTDRGVPFGAPDGSLTRLFFLICCKDDRTHLHVLARLGRVLADTEALSEMMTADGPDALRRAFVEAEARAAAGESEPL
jgi:PTS system nitrogen regulatory IIA component